jgi:transcriptional regulator with XRE-family HTH domain
VENTPELPHADETFAQVLAALKAEYDVKEPAIADRIGVHVSTVNTWANGRANPRANAIRALAREFPKFTEVRLFAAVGRKAPGPASPDRKERMLAILDQLTEEQQELMEIQGKAWADSNRQ